MVCLSRNIERGEEKERKILATIENMHKMGPFNIWNNNNAIISWADYYTKPHLPRNLSDMYLPKGGCVKLRQRR